jgi:hypothetical protein
MDSAYQYADTASRKILLVVHMNSSSIHRNTVTERFMSDRHIIRVLRVRHSPDLAFGDFHFGRGRFFAIGRNATFDPSRRIGAGLRLRVGQAGERDGDSVT